MSGSVSTRTANRQAERVTASGQLRLPVVLRRAAGEVEQQPLAVDDRAQAQHEVALGRLEHVLGVAARRPPSAARQARVRRSE